MMLPQMVPRDDCKKTIFISKRYLWQWNFIIGTNGIHLAWQTTVTLKFDYYLWLNDDILF
jgi:hypothetical protein